ncbi:MAG: type II toxin-antitoxin system VapC family toxin [Moraxellaceae bacterium]|nr:type II toxin-antitoxin system VapC family toxin [Moraxellaceae bacterium]
MIVLDTNVLSELMRAQPAHAVLAWLDRQPTADLFITAITVAEILYGIERLPQGQRREQLSATAGRILADAFTGRVLAFDERAAVAYAALVAAREQSGRPIGMADAQMAAICAVHGLSLATRNTADFVALDIPLIDPWLAT